MTSTFREETRAVQAEKALQKENRSGSLVARIPSLRGQHQELLGEARTVRGRIHAVRRHGRNLMFLDVVGEFEKLQIAVNYKVISAQDGRWHDVSSYSDDWRAATNAFRRGIFISATGEVVTAQDGNVALRAHEIPTILNSPSPGFDPPKALTDDEVTARRRHLDLLANRQALDTLRLRSVVIRAIRSFLNSAHFIEVQTPILAEHAGGAAARPFSTRSAEIGADQPLALRVAPELWLKRLVVGGFERVFEIGPCFRNEGLDGTHNPEFTMCEFYEAYASLDQLISSTERLVATVLEEVQLGALGDAGASHPWQLHGDLSAVAAKLAPKNNDSGPTGLRRVPFVPTLEAALGFQLPDLESETAFEDLTAMLRERGLEPKDGSPPATLPRLLDRLGGDYVESESCGGHAVFVTHHPACMAPLARSARCDQTGQMVALRAELFVDGVELANMYEEEHDPDQQERKFREQARLLRRRQREKMARSLDKEVTVKSSLETGRLQEQDDADADAEAEAEASGALLNGSDASYVEALRAGMPPTGGWGCGIERLVMVLSGAPRIRDVLSFGNLRNVVSVSRPEHPQELGSNGGDERRRAVKP